MAVAGGCGDAGFQIGSVLCFQQRLWTHFQTLTEELNIFVCFVSDARCYNLGLKCSPKVSCSALGLLEGDWIVGLLYSSVD